jgi:dTDP-4-amino-4,6-dideoxygalactose transaminase
MTYIAPAGTPIGVGELLGGLASGLASKSPAQSLEIALRELSSSQRGWLISSGRAAMTVLLRAVRSILAHTGREQVIVAGYTCYSVPASVLLAGLKPRFCDIDPQSVGLDVDKLASFDPRRIAAVVSANLYGIPNKLAEIERWARSHDVLFIDDAAQALGARLGDRAVGGFGDAGIYSFDKGKNITTMQGGAVVCRNETLSAELGRLFEDLPAASASETLALATKLAAYGALLRPSAYGIVTKLPFLGLGTTRWEDDYPIKRYSRTLAGVAFRLLDRLDALTAARAANARALAEALRDVSSIRLVEVPAHGRCAYTRFPILVEDPRKRAAFVMALNAAGIGATESYPLALVDVPELRDVAAASNDSCPASQTIARTIVTLPTHPYCPTHLPERVRAMTREVLGG